MKKILALLCVIGLLVLGIICYLYRGNAIDMSNQDLLVVGTNASFPPFEYRDNGVITGFDIDLMEAIGRQLGKKIVVKDMAFDSLLMEAQAGTVHVLASALTPTPERREKLFFTDLYLADDPLVVITLSSEAPQSLDDLEGKEVIVNDGYTAESYMKQHQNGIMLRSLGTPAEAFLALNNGRAYAYVSARSAVQPFFDRYGIEKFAILTLSVSDSYALAVPRAFPDIFKQIQQALRALEDNGVMKELKNKWHLNF